MSKEIKTVIRCLPTTKIPESFSQVERSAKISFSQKFPKKSRRREYFPTKFMRPSIS
jgi:hypothetical protein